MANRNNSSNDVAKQISTESSDADVLSIFGDDDFISFKRSGDSFSSLDDVQPIKRPCLDIDRFNSDANISSVQLLELCNDLAKTNRFDQLSQLITTFYDRFVFKATMINAIMDISTANFNVAFNNFVLNSIINKLDVDQVADLNAETLMRFCDKTMRNRKGFQMASTMMRDKHMQ